MLQLLRNAELRSVAGRMASVYAGERKATTALGNQLAKRQKQMDDLQATIQKLSADRLSLKGDQDRDFVAADEANKRLIKIEDIISRFVAELDALS